MSSVVERKMTAADLERMPKDGFRYELVDGEIRKFMPPGFEHGDIAMRISAQLAVYVYDNALGSVTAAETGFKIDEFNVRAPDGAFVSNERLQKYGRPAGFFPSAPDLAIEVVSLGDTKREAKEKTEWWLESGARLVWVVDAKRRKVTAHHANGNIFEYGIDDMLDGQDVVPGFKLAVNDVFK